MSRWVLVAALGVPIFVVAVEVACRWWIRRHSRSSVWPPGARTEIRMDPELFPELERRVRFDINADGERGGEVSGREEGLYRILVAGGSAVECFALDQPTSWPGALEHLLHAPAALRALGAVRVHVGNIGHSGVGSADLDVILERVLPQYARLHAIVVMVGASDLYRWLEEGAPPTRPAPPVPEPTLFACHPNQPFRWRPGATALREVARRLRRAWLHPVEVKEHAGAWFRDARRMRAAAREVRTTVADPAIVLDTFEHHFRRLVTRAQAHADRVLVVRQPWFEGDYTPEERARFWHGGAGKPWKEAVDVYYDLDLVNRLLSLIDARAARVAGALDVPHINLRPFLTERQRHYYDHDHYTPAGAAVVARAIAATLLEWSAPAERPVRPAAAAAGRPAAPSGHSPGR